MNPIEIITNNIPRDVVGEQPASDGTIEAYVVYKGVKYPLGDFVSVSGINDHKHPFRVDGWDGFISDTFFSGILLKWVTGTNMEQVVMGRYYA